MAIYISPTEKSHISYIMQLLRAVLENNYSEFNGGHFHHIPGNAMGTMLATSYSDISMTQFEDTYLYTCPEKPF